MGINRINLERLINFRNTILLAEIGALLHDLGKLSDRFISITSKENKDQGKADDHSWWIFQQFDNLRSLLDTPKIRIDDIPVRAKKGLKRTFAEISLYELILNHHDQKFDPNAKLKRIKPNNFDEKSMPELGTSNKDAIKYGKSYILTLFCSSADSIDSAIDKGAVLDENKQSINHVYIASAVGYEFQKIDLKEISENQERCIVAIEGIIRKMQRELLHFRDSDVEKWLKYRQALVEKIKYFFLQALGETRRSANDVTLWDHSFSVASLFKAAIANIILTNKWVDPFSVKWRLLFIRFNGLAYISKSNKVGDILGRKERIEIALDLVKDLLEVYIPLGNEIYRDENGSIFLIPEGLDEIKLCSAKIGRKIIIGNDRHNTINIEDNDSLELAILKIFNTVTLGELKPLIGVSKPSRGAVNLGKVLGDNKVIHNIVFANEIKGKWVNTRAPICKVCGLKPCAKRGNRFLDLCEDCLEIRKRRLESWYKNRIGTHSSIWIDEICDKNKRVGVIIGSFNLDYWLNGMWFNTMFIKTLKDLREEMPEIFNEISEWDHLINAVREVLDKNNLNVAVSYKKTDGTEVIAKELLEALKSDKSYRGDMFKNIDAKKFFESIVTSREVDVISWAYGFDISKLNNEEKAKVLILALFRKNPSFARIRRVWETTKKFWKDIEDIIKRSLGKRERYRIIFKNIDLNMLDSYAAYDLKIRGITIPVVYTGNGEFIIVENWDILKSLKINENILKEALKEGEFELRIPSEYGRASRRIELSREMEFDVIIEKDSEYYPYILILSEPSLFIVLVPLESAWEILMKIKKEYVIWFSKVQNRLPIKLGLIGFKRKFPLYIVLDAVKRFLSEEFEVSSKIFEVTNFQSLSKEESRKMFDNRLGDQVYKLELRNKDKRIIVHVSCSLGDPDLEDKFYPFFVIEETTRSHRHIKTFIYRDYASKFGLKIYVSLKHVSEIERGDKVLFEPSIYDFEFLDSNIRRFDVGKIRRHWLFIGSRSRPKPYSLWDLDNFDRLQRIIDACGLTDTQVTNFYELLVSKIEEWGIERVEDLRSEAFEALVENAIKSFPLRLKITSNETCKDKISKSDYDFLKESIFSGMFFDFFDLWHTILKRKFGERR